MTEKVAMLVRCALDRQFLAPKRGECGFGPDAPSMSEVGALQPAGRRGSSRNWRQAEVLSPPMFLIDEQGDLLAVAAH